MIKSRGSGPRSRAGRRPDGRRRIRHRSATPGGRGPAGAGRGQGRRRPVRRRRPARRARQHAAAGAGARDRARRRCRPGARAVTAPVPLYQAKAEFFRVLGHPVRIRVLELLQDGPRPVRDLLAEIGIEASSLSQQLAVLRRYGIVVSRREASSVVYEIAGGDIAELLRTARRILTELIAGQNELLAELREAEA